jgi:GTP-binding protein
VLVHVLDASGGLEGRDPLEDFDTVNAELDAYEEDLLAKPMLVALNKVDIPEAQQNLPAMTGELERRGYAVYPISAATNEGVPLLMQAVAASLREALEREVEVEKPQERRRYTLESVDERAWQAQQISRHHFAVTGVGVERFTVMTDFSRDEGQERFERFLESSGITAELERLGVDDGDIVHIGNHELVWGDQDDYEEATPRRSGKGAGGRSTSG